MSALLEVTGLKVDLGGVQVLDVPRLEVAAGTVLALIGPNGSGKTTLLKTLAGLLPAREGRIAFDGAPLGPDYRRRVTMVFQAPLLFDLSVRGNLESGLRLRGLPAEERNVRVTEAAARFGLTELLDRSARHLSGGEAQRTSLARAFALRPELLVLDEPFSALDPPTREGLVTDLARVLRETRTTALMATHDQAEALRLADRIAVLREGRVAQEGPVAEVFHAPVDAFVAGFVGMETVLTGRVASAHAGEFRVDVGPCQVVALGGAGVGEEVRLGIRPEHVILGRGPAGPTSARNAFTGRVAALVPMGPFVRVEVDCGFPLAAYVTPASRDDLALAEGTEVTAAFKATSVHLLRP